MNRTRIKRSKLAHYMNVGGSTFKRIGPGFSSFSKSLNPQTDDIHDIDTDIGETILNGYKPTYEYEFQAVSGDPICEKLREIHEKLIVGASVEILDVYLDDEGTDETFRASKARYNVIPSEGPGGASNEGISCSGQLSQSGELIFGTARIAADGTITFTKEDA